MWVGQALGDGQSSFIGGRLRRCESWGVYAISSCSTEVWMGQKLYAQSFCRNGGVLFSSCTNTVHAPSTSCALRGVRFIWVFPGGELCLKYATFAGGKCQTC